MSETQTHTPGRLRISGKHGHRSVEVSGADCGSRVAIACATCDPTNDMTWTPARVAGNARRLVACWNACEGIPTEGLEQRVVKELLEACEGLREWVGGYALDIIPNDAYQRTGGREIMERAANAIAKATP